MIPPALPSGSRYVQRLFPAVQRDPPSSVTSNPPPPATASTTTRMPLAGGSTPIHGSGMTASARTLIRGGVTRSVWRGERRTMPLAQTGGFTHWQPWHASPEPQYVYCSHASPPHTSPSPHE